MFTAILKRYAAVYSLLGWLGVQTPTFGLSPLSLPASTIDKSTKYNPATTPPLAAITSPKLSGPASVSVIDPAKCYRLVSRLSGKVVEVDGASANDGAPLRQRTDANQLAQGWQLTPAEAGYYRLSVLHNQKGIQVNNASTAESAPLEQWTYWGGSHQQWALQRNAEGYYTLSNRNSGKAMTVRSASTAEGADIIQQALGTGQHQQWSIEERSCTTTPTTNRPPVVIATSTSLTGTSPLSVTFTANKSYDPDGDPIAYEWDFGDETSFSTEANPVKVFTAKPGKSGVGLILRYTVRLTVIDSKGLRSAVQTFDASLNNNPPTVRITNPVTNAKYSLDKTTSYTLAATVTGNGIASQIWQVKLRRTASEQLVKTTSGANPAIDISPVGCDGTNPYYLIAVKVTDAAGQSAQDSVKIYPDCTTPSLAVTNLTATPFNYVNTVQLNWTNPVIPFDDVLVVGKAGAGFTDIPLDPLYTANASFTGNGSALYGGKVLYQGTGTSVNVTDLTGGQKYYFRVFTRKGNGWNGGVEISATPATSNRAPVVVATSTSLTGSSPLSVTFTGNRSSDPDGDPITYQWDFGDGSFSTDANPVKVFTIQPGRQGVPQTSYSVKLTVSDNRGGIASSQSLLVSLRSASTTTIDPNKCYRLVSRLSGKVVGVEGSAPDDGAPLRQRTDANQLAQGWQLTPAEAGYYRLSVLHNQKGIQVNNASTAESAPLEQWTYWGGSHQQWALQRNAEGYYTLSNRNSGKAMTVRSASTAEGADIVQQALGTGQHQQWSIEERGCTTGGRVGVAEPGMAFSLWPNPANDHVLIDLSPAAGKPVGLQVNDLLGRPLQQTQLEVAPAAPYRYQTDQLPNGLYLIQLTPTGQLPTTLKLLIQR
ncbi:RICIN domain-containing protein [Fibrella arboris]|uniref:RICIN domain-containing protein n=1 Tax=Fibrella arboris TaxID=3242486 RepID=UPI0035211FD0